MITEAEIENLALPTIELNKSHACSLLSCFLDEQINTIKIQDISNWERNHDYQLNINKKLIDDLEKKKDAIQNYLNQYGTANAKFDIQVNLTISAKKY